MPTGLVCLAALRPMRDEKQKSAGSPWFLELTGEVHLNRIWAVVCCTGAGTGSDLENSQ